LKGKNIAIITHAGGPAVMLTDALSHGGLEVPNITGQKADELKTRLFTGSSVSNPIDFLATGTAEQLGFIIDAVNQDFDNIDAMIVIFGTPGLAPIFDVYDLLLDKMKSSTKPIYPVLPSVLTAAEEVKSFVDGGGVFFPDEVVLGNALTRVYFAPKPSESSQHNYNIDKTAIRKVVDDAEDGYLSPEMVQQLLDAAGISRAVEKVVSEPGKLSAAVAEVGFPLVMKVVGPVHKSDVGGVTLNITTIEKASAEMNRMMKIDEATGVLLQPMLSGIELFAGIKREDKFGHMILFGLGGIFIEVLKDVQKMLAPVTEGEVLTAMTRLRAFKLIQGVRGQQGVNQELFARAVAKLSALVEVAPEIAELDLNPLLGTSKSVVAVDARIRIEK
ncbi:MAG: acetate--CoA ligase family protein, partial [Bacteroidales bacterium]